MFHLFDKVYLAPDHLTDTRENRVIVSARMGHPFSAEIEPFFKGKVLHSELDFDKFYTEKWVSLLKELKQSDQRVVIYCDDKAYKELIASWLCSVMPQLNLPMFQTLFYTLIVREKAIQEFGPSNLPEGPTLEISHKQVAALYERHASTTIFGDFIEKNWDCVSLEYQIAHFLKTKDERFLAPKVPVFINRYFSRMVLEIRRHLLLDLFNKKQNAACRYTNDRLANMPDPFAVVRGFDILTSQKVKFQKRSVSHLTDEELSQLRQDISNFLVTQVGYNEAMVEPALLNLKNANKQPEDFKDEDIELFLAAIRNVRSESSIISLVDNETINTVAISMFLSSPLPAIKALRFAPER